MCDFRGCSVAHARTHKHTHKWCLQGNGYYLHPGFPAVAASFHHSEAEYWPSALDTDHTPAPPQPDTPAHTPQAMHRICGTLFKELYIGHAILTQPIIP